MNKEDILSSIAEAYGFRKDYNMAYPCIDKSSIITVWEKRWWSFLQWLARALTSADAINEKKIRDTFDNYIVDYLEEIITIEKKSLDDVMKG